MFCSRARVKSHSQESIDWPPQYTYVPVVCFNRSSDQMTSIGDDRGDQQSDGQNHDPRNPLHNTDVDTETVGSTVNNNHKPRHYLSENHTDTSSGRSGVEKAQAADVDEFRYSTEETSSQMIDGSNSLRRRETAQRSSYDCDACRRTFTNTRSLNRHKQTHGSSVKRYVCEICNKRFNESHNLQVSDGQIKPWFDWNSDLITCDDLEKWIQCFTVKVKG